MDESMRLLFEYVVTKSRGWKFIAWSSFPLYRALLEFVLIRQNTSCAMFVVEEEYTYSKEVLGGHRNGKRPVFAFDLSYRKINK